MKMYSGCGQVTAMDLDVKEVGNISQTCTAALVRRTVDEKLLSNILAATQHELAVDAIASIIFSPGTVERFGKLAADARCPSCLIYGRHDPWVRPVWGQRLKRLVPNAAYFEVRTPYTLCWKGLQTPVASLDTLIRLCQKAHSVRLVLHAPYFEVRAADSLARGLELTDVAVYSAPLYGVLWLLGNR